MARRRHIAIESFSSESFKCLQFWICSNSQMCGNSGSHWKREPEVSGVILRPIVVIGLAKMALLDLCHLSFLVELELWNMPLRSIDAGPQHNLVICDGILDGCYMKSVMKWHVWSMYGVFHVQTIKSKTTPKMFVYRFGVDCCTLNSFHTTCPSHYSALLHCCTVALLRNCTLPLYPFCTTLSPSVNLSAL